MNVLIRSASVAACEVLADAPGEALAGSSRRGRPSRRSRHGPPPAASTPRPAAGDVSPRAADLLWEPLSPEDTRGLEEFSRRAARAAGDFRTLVEIVRDGNVLIVFPEGRPSPDGEIGRQARGSARSSAAASRVPSARSHSPTIARSRAHPRHLALGEPVEPPTEDVEGALLALLRVTMPLTCGQVVAARLQAGADADLHALERDLGDAVAVAREEGRPVEPDLATAAGRRRRLTEALAVAPRRAADLPFLAREYASARGFVNPNRQPDSCAGSRRRPSRRGNAGLTRIAPMSVTGRTARACIVSTYAVALSGLTSMPFAASNVR